jgi:hypothetical protein
VEFLGVDFMPVQDPELLVNVTAADEDACRGVCDAEGPSCVFYRYDPDPESAVRCGLYRAPTAAASGTATVELGIKVDWGSYAVYPANIDSTKVGVTVRTVVVASAVGCVTECDRSDSCAAVVVRKLVTGDGGAVSYICSLQQGSESSEGIHGQYQVSGTSIGNWSV